MKKFYLILMFCLLLLTSCGAKNTIDDKVIIVGASASPHAEILEEARSYIEEQGYKLEIKVYDDYILPNVALHQGELDANYFQHKPYLDTYNEKNRTNLVSVHAVHYEPLALYAGKSNSLDNVKEGTKIALPVDSSNFARGLLLLQTLGIITVDNSKGMLITEKDILDNPHKVEIIAFDARAIPLQLDNVDYAVINGNYANGANIPSSKILGTEDSQGIAATTYANIIAIKKGNEAKKAIQVLIEALSQEKVKNFIENNYDKTVLPL